MPDRLIDEYHRLRAGAQTVASLQAQIERAAMGLDIPQDMPDVHSMCELAKRLHSGQLRADNQPYITHPIRVALLYHHAAAEPSRVGVGTALLHDTIEDCGMSCETLVELVGPDIAMRVEALSRTMSENETKDERRAHKLAKWKRIYEDGDRDSQIVQLADVLDNLIAIRNLATSEMSSAKVPRWLMQAARYHIPAANRVDARFAQAMQEEINLSLGRGFRFGGWEDE